MVSMSVPKPSDAQVSWLSQAAIAASMQRTERRLSDVLHAPTLGPLAAHLVMADGAKRARPMLVAAIAHALTHPPQAQQGLDFTDLAVAIELIHGASLMHDDIVDDSNERRGRPTLHQVSSRSRAILAGDWCLARAVQLCAPYGVDVVTACADVVVAMSEAAAEELSLRATLPSVVQWEHIARGKTGVLFGLCAQGVALGVGERALANMLQSLLSTWGAAFQAIDDVIDVVGGADKPRFRDLAEKNPSLVLIEAASQPSMHARIASLWSQPQPNGADVERVGAEVLASGAVQRALAFADAKLHEVDVASRNGVVPPAVHAALQPVMAWAADHRARVAARL
jgi:octaprenyl-diphosphate synthase